MKQVVLLVFIALGALFIEGCSKDSPNAPVDQAGQVHGGLFLKIDKVNAPAQVSTITAYLSGQGLDTLSKTMNIKTDTTAEISFDNIQIGQWHLKIDAKSQLGTVLYSGESDVTVLEAATTQVNLTLNPTGSGVGSMAANGTRGIQTGIWTNQLILSR